jgi:hypothetical protein
VITREIQDVRVCCTPVWRSSWAGRAGSIRTGAGRRPLMPPDLHGQTLKAEQATKPASHITKLDGDSFYCATSGDGFDVHIVSRQPRLRAVRSLSVE